MSRFLWLVRREFWEHRGIWIAPAIVLLLLLVGAVAGNVFFGDVQIKADVEINDSSPASVQVETEETTQQAAAHEAAKPAGKSKLRPLSTGEAIASVPPEKRETLLVIVYAAVAALLFFVVGIIGFFYSLDSLYSDRRDRSVLFWKSLPLSDAETVLSKFATAAVALPCVAAVAAIAGQLIIALGGSAKLAFIGADAGIMWMPGVIGGGAISVIVLAAICALWYAPLVAYLQLASAWAPRSPFLWAVLPPAAAVMLEKLAFGTKYIITFIGYRITGPVAALFNDDRVQMKSPVHAGDLIANVSDLLVSAHLLLGLLAAALLLAGAIWVRRYRDEAL